MRPTMEYLRAFLASQVSVRGDRTTLATEATISRGYLNDMIKPSKTKCPNPRLDKVDKIAAACGVPVSAIFNEAVFGTIPAGIDAAAVKATPPPSELAARWARLSASDQRIVVDLMDRLLGAPAERGTFRPRPKEDRRGGEKDRRRAG